MKKVLSILLTVLMLASFASIAFAADGAIKVRFSVYDGTLFISDAELDVADGLAEQYGFAMPAEDHNDVAINQPTVLDALVAAHVYKYGDAFTAATAGNYLKFGDYGYMTLAFGKNASSTGFTVNNAAPYDDVVTEYTYNGTTYQSTTGYSANEARLADGDSVQLYFYQDTSYYTDMVSWFECDTASGSEVDAGSSLVLTLKGVGSFAFSDPNWASRVSALAGVDVYAKKGDGAFAKVGATDENGKFTVSAAEAGDYTYVAYGVEDEYDSPVIPAYFTVTVKAQQSDDSGSEGKLSLWQRIVAFFKKIIDFFKNLFNFNK